MATRHEQKKAAAAALARMREDPAAFRAVLVIDTDDGPRRLGDCLDDWQRQDFEAIDPAWRHVVFRSEPPPQQRAWLERPRGHSKTNDLAVMVAWALFASTRRLTGLAAAADKEQAGLLRDKISSLVQSNPWLTQYLDVKADRVVNPTTESTLKIITSDAPTSYGETPDFVICDEVTHWKKRDLFDSLFSSAAKRKHCLFLVICNAGFEESWQWDVREAARENERWYFNALDGPVASWFSPHLLDEQRRLLPRIAFERLWLNRWGTGSGDAIDPDDLTAAIHTGTTTPAEHPAPGWCYAAGVDLGLKRDAAAVVVVGRHVGHVETIEKEKSRQAVALEAAIDLGFIEPAEADGDEIEYRYHDATGRLAVARVDLWQPARGDRVSLTEIEKTISRLNELFQFAAIGCDPWQAAMLIERLRAAGIPIEPVDFVPQNLRGMATATLEAFREQTIDLPDHPQLIADLRKLRVSEKSYGVRLESPRDGTGHGDCATGLAIALLIASRTTATPPARIDGPLLCSP